jgi:putative NADH-flavin reductase
MKQNKKIAILGATGVTGNAVVREALRRGYDVHALARTPSKLRITDPALKVLEGSSDDLSVVLELLTGCCAVISTLGPGFDKAIARKMVSTAATRNVIQAMNQLKIKRYVVMSGASVVMPADKTTSFANIITRFVFPLLLGDILRDKCSEYELLKLSNLDWTLVRCPRLREAEGLSRLVIQHTKHNTLWVDKTSLAEFLVSQIESDKFLRTGIFAFSKLRRDDGLS